MSEKRGSLVENKLFSRLKIDDALKFFNSYTKISKSSVKTSDYTVKIIQKNICFTKQEVTI